MSEHRDQHGLGTGRKEAKGDHNANEVDRASADSFPASDPPAHSGITGPGEPAQEPARPASPERGKGEQPTGRPTSDRHATETTSQWEDQEQPHKPAKGRDL
jgi:hypothetical protein